MSDKLYDRLIKEIDNGKYHLNFQGDRENFLVKIENLFYDNELSEKEYESIFNYVTGQFEELPNCILEDMRICDPDLFE